MAPRWWCRRVRGRKGSGSQSDSDDAKLNVAFVTDVEGNFEYLARFVARSVALTLERIDAEDGSMHLALADGWMLLFGGDACDKGGAVGGTLRVVRTLVRLKRRYPERVTLLLGNRDINKIRMTSELAPPELRNYAEMPGPSWVAADRRVSPEMHLRRQCARTHGVPPEEVNAEMLERANTLAERIRWMLKETMGSDGEFDRRRAELTLLRQQCPPRGASPDQAQAEQVSEEDTARSFVESVQAGGCIYDLLQLGQVRAHGAAKHPAPPTPPCSVPRMPGLTRGAKDVLRRASTCVQLMPPRVPTAHVAIACP